MGLDSAPSPVQTSDYTQQRTKIHSSEARPDSGEYCEETGKLTFNSPGKHSFPDGG